MEVTSPSQVHPFHVEDGSGSPVIFEKKTTASTASMTPMIAEAEEEKKAMCSSSGGTTKDTPVNTSLFLPGDPHSSAALQQNTTQIYTEAPLGAHKDEEDADGDPGDEPTTAIVPPLISTMAYAETPQNKAAVEHSCSTMTPDVSAQELVTDADDEKTAAEGDGSAGPRSSSGKKKVRTYRHDPYAVSVEPFTSTALDASASKQHVRNESVASNQSAAATTSTAQPGQQQQQQQQQQNFLQMQYYQLQMGRASGAAGADAAAVSGSFDPYSNSTANVKTSELIMKEMKGMDHNANSASQQLSHERHRGETLSEQGENACSTSQQLPILPAGQQAATAIQKLDATDATRRRSIPMTQSAAHVQYEESLLNYGYGSASAQTQVSSQCDAPLNANDNDNSKKNTPKYTTNNPYATRPTQQQQQSLPPLAATEAATAETVIEPTDGEVSVAAAEAASQVSNNKARVKIATIAFSIDELYHCNVDQLRKSANALKFARHHSGSAVEAPDKKKFCFRARAGFRVSPGDKVVVEYLVREKDLSSVDFYYYDSSVTNNRSQQGGELNSASESMDMLIPGASNNNNAHKQTRSPVSQQQYRSNRSSGKNLAFLSRSTDDSTRTKSRNVILCKHLGEVVRIDEEDEQQQQTQESPGDSSATPHSHKPMVENVLPRILRRATSTDIRKYELLRLCDAVSVTEAQRVVTKLYKDGVLYQSCQSNNNYYHRKGGSQYYSAQNLLDGHLIDAITNPRFLQILLPPASGNQATTSPNQPQHLRRTGASTNGASSTPLLVRSVEWLFDKSAAIAVVALPSPFLRQPPPQQIVSLRAPPSSFPHNAPQPFTAAAALTATAINETTCFISNPHASGGPVQNPTPSPLLPIATDTSSVSVSGAATGPGASGLSPINERNVLSLLGNIGSVGSRQSQEVTTAPALAAVESAQQQLQQLQGPYPEDQMHYMPVYRRLLPLLHDAIAQRLQTNVLLKVVLTE